MKKDFIMGVIFVILLTIITAIMLPRSNKKNYSKELNEIINKSKPRGDLVTIEYSNSGDMLGNVDVIELKKTEDKYILTTRYAQTHNDEIEERSKEISKKDWDNIQDKIDKYNFAMFSTLEMEDIMVYDAATEVIKLTYTKDNIGDYYNIYQYMKMPDDTRKVYNEIISDIKALAK